MDVLLTAALFLTVGAVIATCFWVSYLKARDEGYRRGYAQASYEHQMVEEAKGTTLFGKAIVYDDECRD